MIDRQVLRRLHAEEERRFIDTHPRSAVLAKEAQTNLLGGVPMAWMTRWPGSFPIFFDIGARRPLHRCRRPRLRRLLPRRHRGDDRPRDCRRSPRRCYAQAQRGITTMLPSVDAAWVGAELARRFGLPVWQMAMTATDANRFVLRFARLLTGRPQGAGVRLVLPRHGRRGAGNARRRGPHRRPARQHRRSRSIRRRPRSSSRSTISTPLRPHSPRARSPACSPSRH